MNRLAFLGASATHFVEPKADFDQGAFAEVVGRGAQIRQWWEAVAFKP